MVTKDYSKSRMRENRTYGSVRGGQSNLIPSTRLTRLRREGCGGASHQKGCISDARRAVVKVLYKLAASIIHRRPTTTLSGIAAVSRVDGIRLLCPPLTEPYVRFSRIRLLE